MKKQKPKVFIGSSRESMEYVTAIQKQLSYVAEVNPWTAGTFKSLKYTMEDLEEQLEVNDFAVFVCSPDDYIVIREKEYNITRDNTLFEMGLFWGKLKRGRVFFLVPDEIYHTNDNTNYEGYHILSDFTGLNPLKYDYYHSNKEAAVNVACADIIQAINKLGPFENKKEILDQALARQSERDAIAIFLLNFTKELIADNTRLYEALIDSLRSVYGVLPNFVVKGLGVWKKEGSEGLRHVCGIKGKEDFYPFNINQGKTEIDKRIHVVDCFNKSCDTITLTKNHFVKTYLVCYPIQNELVLTVTINGPREMTMEESALLFPLNSGLIKTVNDLLGGFLIG